MPIKISAALPAYEILRSENIFVMDERRAFEQDIRPLQIAILNLMPDKVTAETQLLRLIGNSPLQVEITLLHPASHLSKNTSGEHLTSFYATYDAVKHKKFDGLIITGAPVEQLPFEQVDYWKELQAIMDWSIHHVYSTLHICWGAQAGLYHHYGIDKQMLDEKAFGIFEHSYNEDFIPLFRGFDDIFYVPHSRHTKINREDIQRVKELKILSESEEAGVYAVVGREGRQIFITGHPEYDAASLKAEYERDIARELKIDLPKHYFVDDDPTKPPIVTWRSHANLLYCNWLNYYVYQQTPYQTELID